jgi:hypothetical protein
MATNRGTVISIPADRIRDARAVHSRRMTVRPDLAERPAQAVTAAPDDALLCPGCGFDLRGTPGDRCGECGLVFDREALRESGFPWAHRARIGRVRAYLKTVSLVTLDRRVIRQELAKPQDLADAKAFARVTACLVALALVGAFAMLIRANDGSLEFLGVSRQPYAPPRAWPSGPIVDVVVPWSAGATLWPVLPVSLVLLAVFVTGAPRTIFALRKFPQHHRRRGAAISYYITAPLAMLVPAMLWVALLNELVRGEVPLPLFLDTTAGLTAEFLVGGAILATLWSCGQWARRAKHSGISTTALAAGELLLLWLIGAGLLLGFVPWCVGFTWIVIDSLR